MESDLKIQHSVYSTPYKVWGTFFKKKSFAWRTNFFGQIFWGMFYIGTNDQIMQEWLRGFKGRVKLICPFIDPDLGYWYIIWKVNTTSRGLNLKNTFCTLCLWGWGFHVKSVFFFLKKKYSGDLFFDVLIRGSYRFTNLRAWLMEMWVKKLHSESEGSLWHWVT